MKSFKVDFFVVGAARCGTTSLYNYLNQHPEIFLPNIKELNHFSEVESKELSDYKKPKKDREYHTKIIKSYEIYKGLYKNARENQLKGDISPSYLSNTTTAQRIFNHNPDAKIIISLRNPIHRAFSHYAMNFGVGYDLNESFEKSLKAKKKQIWGGGNQYLELSNYFKPVESYYRHFDFKKIHLMIFEEWTRDKDSSLRNILEFLGVDKDTYINHNIKHNEKVAYKNIKTLNVLRNKYIKSFIDTFLLSKAKEKLKSKWFKKDEFDMRLSTETENELKDYFREEVERLEQLVKIPLIKTWKFKQ
jgi:hypothetical protein